MTKVLIAVMGCELHATDGHYQAIRETWGKDAQSLIGDLRFFTGRGIRPLEADEVRLDVPDPKSGLLEKVSAILHWAIDHGYDSIFKVNTNTYCNIAEIEKTGHWKADYAGAPVGTLGENYSGVPGIYGFIQGASSWLSVKAARLVMDELVPCAARMGPGLMDYRQWISPYPHSEDLWISQCLVKHLPELLTVQDPRYGSGPLTFWSQSDFVKNYKLREWMNRLHDARADAEEMRRIDAQYIKGWR